jgi:hypothetical protein
MRCLRIYRDFFVYYTFAYDSFSRFLISLFPTTLQNCSKALSRKKLTRNIELIRETVTT